MEREFPDLPRARMGLAVADPGILVRAAERGRQGISPDEVVLMHLGFLTPEKGLGQILAGTTFEAFLDPENRHSRLKQYQMER